MCQRASEHPALGSVHSTAKEKQEGMLTTHLLATNLAAKCNQLVSQAPSVVEGGKAKLLQRVIQCTQISLTLNCPLSSVTVEGV